MGPYLSVVLKPMAAKGKGRAYDKGVEARNEVIERNLVTSMVKKYLQAETNRKFSTMKGRVTYVAFHFDVHPNSAKKWEVGLSVGV